MIPAMLVLYIIPELRLDIFLCDTFPFSLQQRSGEKGDGYATFLYLPEP